MSSNTKERAKRHTETSDYAAFLLRAITRLGERIADDPAMLAHVEEISQALTDAVNRGIFAAKNKEWQPYSLAEMGRIYGCSYQNIQQRAKRGEAATVAYEARRSGGAIVRIGDIRAARAARLNEAGVQDITGSAHERSALRATGTDNIRALRS
jgi:hypothetical protein